MPAKIIDLTMPLRPGMRGVESSPKFTLAREGWNAATWQLYSHAGTHMDAQMHFAAGPETIDVKPLEHCMGPAWIVPLVPTSPRALLEVTHLGPVAEQCQPGDSVLLRTDWHKHADDAALYRDGLPRISDELARWCVTRRVKILGVEPPSIGDVNNLAEVTRLHQILLSGGVTIVEGLAYLDRLTQPKVFFAALPLKLAGGDGCPVRAFAVEGVPADGWLGGDSR